MTFLKLPPLKQGTNNENTIKIVNKILISRIKQVVITSIRMNSKIL